jgi:cell division transport system permease protein
VVVVAISLSLLGTGLLFVKQVDNTRSYWQSRVQLSVYLCSNASVSPACAKSGQITSSEQQIVFDDLKANKDVLSVTYLPQSQAYAQFKSEFANSPTLVRYTSENQIPASFEVRLRNTEADAAPIAQYFDGVAGVAQVVDDSSILDKFYALLDSARDAVAGIAVFLLLAAILLVANTIRLSAFNRRRETSIMRLVGASNFYVQLPFLAEGMIAGVFGWLIAAGLLIAVKTLWLNGLQSYFPYGVELSTTDLIEVVIIALIAALLICGTTSFLTLRRYLRV